MFSCLVDSSSPRKTQLFLLMVADCGIKTGATHHLWSISECLSTTIFGVALLAMLKWLGQGYGIQEVQQLPPMRSTGTRRHDDTIFSSP